MTEEKKGMGGVSGWLSALMGKPKTVTLSVPQTVTPEKPVEVAPVKSVIPEPLTITDLSKEDSVKEDIVKFKAFIGKYKKQADTKMAPMTQRGYEAVGKMTATADSVSDRPFYKKMLNLFFTLFFVLILVYVGATLYNIWRGKNPVNQTSEEPTPTPVPFVPAKPSVYAKDEVILKIEEDINVLKNELIRVSLRENDLQPPRLDFDVTFK